MGMETDTDYSNVPNSIDSRQINIKNGDKDIQFHVVNYCSVPKFLVSWYFLREMLNAKDYNVHDDCTSHLGEKRFVLGFGSFNFVKEDILARRFCFLPAI